MGNGSSKIKKQHPHDKEAKRTGSRKAKKKEAKSKKKGVRNEENELQTAQDGHRKDSDVEDLKIPPERPRSDSQKSMRFSDFTKLDRQPKVDARELLPVDIAFFQDGKIEPEELCHVCGVYTGSETMTCGVCYRVFHEGCLSKIGQWCGGPNILAGQDRMWTCHQCANLGNLLTEEEIVEVLKRLEKCGIRREDELSVSDYMLYCQMSLQEDEGKTLTREKADNARRRFMQVDVHHSGRITWCQFLNIETVRILHKRSKNALVRLLTPAELERARDAFRRLDTDMDGRITKQIAHDNLDRNSRRSGYYPDETMMYIDDDLNISISWTEFLRDRAIYIIAERPCLKFPPTSASCNRRSLRPSLTSCSSVPSSSPPYQKPLPFQNRGSCQINSLDFHADSVPTTPGRKSVAITPGNPTVTWNQGSSRTSLLGAVPISPVSKGNPAFPLLPPPPSSRVGASHHFSRGAASVPTTPEKKTAPDIIAYSSTSSSATAQISHQTQSDFRDSGLPNHSPGTGLTYSSHMNRQVTAAEGRHSRAVAAPAYGKLVERMQTGDWHKRNVRSMVMSNDQALQLTTPTFGVVTVEQQTNSGRRPLSLI